MAKFLCLVSLAASAFALRDSDIERNLKEYLTDAKFDLTTFDLIPDKINTGKYTRMPMRRVCIMRGVTGCNAELSMTLGIDHLAGFRSTYLGINDVVMTSSDECTMMNRDICRNLDLNVTAALAKFKARFTGNIDLTVFDRTFSIGGNLYVYFKNMGFNADASLKASAMLGFRCQAEKPMIHGLSIGTFGYDGWDYDFDISGLLGGNSYVGQITEKAVETALSVMVNEVMDFSEDEVESQAYLPDSAKGHLTDTLRSIVMKIVSQIKFNVNEPKSVCG